MWDTGSWNLFRIYKGATSERVFIARPKLERGMLCLWAGCMCLQLLLCGLRAGDRRDSPDSELSRQDGQFGERMGQSWEQNTFDQVEGMKPHCAYDSTHCTTWALLVGTGGWVVCCDCIEVHSRERVSFLLTGLSRDYSHGKVRGGG